MPQDQRSDELPHAGESAGQSGFLEIDLGSMALTLSDTACSICGCQPRPGIGADGRFQ
jgi:hypothetical protein